ncbi:methyltransferase domain-containing protein [Bifidobacterium crudilactis]|jgi:ubiquinone/menaquinone biosynthesis C-methylase UbiE|uniref:class I SAM-dependent methyltransferase n=1 Tax=Bifidobacterium crudilactis TaxID=327277 RepID=UPI003A5BD902
MTDHQHTSPVSQATRRHAGEELPFSERDSAHIPGHWLLARLGKRVLRPGGRELTRQMLSHAGMEGHKVVEFAPGLGSTAKEILQHAPASYVGVDEDRKAAAIVDNIVAGTGHAVTAKAQETGLPDDSADVVVGEAMLTMQSDKGKQSIIAEAARLLRPGGRYAIHELGLEPDNLDDETKTLIRKSLARAIKVNARPLTAAEWKALLESEGFEVDWIGSAPMALLDIRRNVADEGIVGVLRILRNLIRDKQARERVMTMKRAFTQYRQHMNGIAVVAHKR